MIMTGDSQQLAQWAYRKLQQRTSGMILALVVKDDSASFIDTTSKKFARIESEHPETIAGYYQARQNCKPLLSVEELRGDIEAVQALMA